MLTSIKHVDKKTILCEWEHDFLLQETPRALDVKASTDMAEKEWQKKCEMDFMTFSGQQIYLIPLKIL